MSITHLLYRDDNTKIYRVENNTLLFAIEEGAANIVEKILEFEVEIDKVEFQYKGYKGFNFKYNQNPPLHLAINKCNLET